MAEQKQVKVTISHGGDFKFEALKGFSGTSCVEETKDLELMLAGSGSEVDEGKKPEYYEGDAFTNIESRL